MKTLLLRYERRDKFTLARFGAVYVIRERLAKDISRFELLPFLRYVTPIPLHFPESAFIQLEIHVSTPTRPRGRHLYRITVS